MSVADAVLEIIPDSVLQFILSTKEATPTCILELRHPDCKAPPIAYKVKTTQPRRYLVRPNQGLIAPGGAQKVQILLVEKDKNSLMQSFQRLGQSALDHSKDKFLVQSVAVLDSALASELKEYDKLTSLWSSVSSGGGTTPAGKDSPATSAVANKKLHVRHTVVEAGSEAAAAAAAAGAAEGIKSPEAVAEAKRTVSVSSREPVDALSTDQLKSELANLRRKYDELVAFSVNLTAERDMLSNTLEQTKRDLNRQVAKTAAADNARGFTRTGVGGATGGGGSRSGTSFFMLLVIAVVMLALGVKLDRMGVFPSSIPFLGEAATEDLSSDDTQDEL